jgi:imidazolonepropionase-like amidohydrolase
MQQSHHHTRSRSGLGDERGDQTPCLYWGRPNQIEHEWRRGKFSIRPYKSQKLIKKTTVKITETRSAQDCYFSDEETAACVDEAHSLGKHLCAHARARDSVKMCVRHGIDVIYHVLYIDGEGMDMLEKKKHKHIVALGLNWLIATRQYPKSPIPKGVNVLKLCK